MVDDSFTNRMKKKFGMRGQSWQPSSQVNYPRKPAVSAPRLSINDTTSASGQPIEDNIQVYAGASLGRDERGAVWPPFPKAAFPPEGGLQITPYDIPETDIRTALLFFDKFDVPSQNFVSWEGWCEPLFRSIGVLAESKIGGAGKVTSILQGISYATFEARDAQEPGRWTMARPAQAFGIPVGQLTPNSAFAITLENALPTFTREVALEDIMEFKKLRWAELLSLRYHLDELCADVSRNGANEFTDSVAFRGFEKSLSDYIEVMNGSNRQKMWTSLKASVDWPAAAGSFADVAFTGTLHAGSLVTAATSVGIKTIAGLRRKREASNPFEYLTSAHLEL